MSSKDHLIEVFNNFTADVITQTATLAGVALSNIKDDKIVFVDGKGAKYTMPVQNIEKIIFQARR